MCGKRRPWGDLERPGGRRVGKSKLSPRVQVNATSWPFRSNACRNSLWPCDLALVDAILGRASTCACQNRLICRTNGPCWLTKSRKSAFAVNLVSFSPTMGTRSTPLSPNLIHSRQPVQDEALSNVELYPFRHYCQESYYRLYVARPNLPPVVVAAQRWGAGRSW
jgi:hypothetical protein